MRLDINKKKVRLTVNKAYNRQSVHQTNFCINMKKIEENLKIERILLKFIG